MSSKDVLNDRIYELEEEVKNLKFKNKWSLDLLEFVEMKAQQHSTYFSKEEKEELFDVPIKKIKSLLK